MFYFFYASLGEEMYYQSMRQLKLLGFESMKTLVMKFGGTSVANLERIKKVEVA